MTDIDGVETKEDVLEWVGTNRQWKDSVRNKISRENLFKLCRILTGRQMMKTKALLVTEVVGSLVS